MTKPQRIYLDQAATSWPKHDQVLQAMDHCARHVGATAGRGNYQSADQSQSFVDAARREIALLIGAASSNEISLHASGTAALNTAIHGLLCAGDHVVTTAADHNSVLRPLHHLHQSADIELTIVDCDRFGQVNPDDILSVVRPQTKLVAVTHASNVTGAVQPINQIGAALKDHAAIFLVDAAQTVGYLSVDVRTMQIDLLAAPGHKGAGGPLGTGFLYALSEHHEALKPLIQGGTGSQSESLEMPDRFPQKLEAGNANVPALAGLAAAIALVRDEGIESISDRLRNLAQRMNEALTSIPGINLFSPLRDLPIASLQLAGATPSDIAAILDSNFAVEARAGLHCAALIHEFLKSGPNGTLRLSAGHATTESEVDNACAAIAQIAQELNRV